jgi:carbon-monoxide dehydrogenase medium subunit
VKPAPFDYHRPESVDEALALLAEHGYDAKLLAGGQSLVPAMNFRLAAPAVLIDLNRIPGLDAIAETEGGVRIGAMVRQRAAERSAVVAARAPLVAETLPWVAHAQIRNRGTMGGSIAHADPAAELPAVMLALGARFEARGAGGARQVAADDFFTGLFATALEPEEILVGIEIPAAAPGTGFAFDELSRRHGDFALAGGGGGGAIGRGGPLRRRAHRAPERGRRAGAGRERHRRPPRPAPTAEAVAAAADAAARLDIDPPGDIHASAAYRRHITGVLVRRVLPRAFGRAAP